MSYIEKNLLDGEQIIYRTKKHFIIFLVPVILTIMTVFFYTNPILAQIAWIAGLATLISWANQALTYVTSEYVITNKRLMMKEGFFFRRANEMRLTTITNVAITQSLLGQLLNYGSLIINSFGGVDDVFSLIDHPFAFQKQVQAQLDKTSK